MYMYVCMMHTYTCAYSIHWKHRRRETYVHTYAQTQRHTHTHTYRNRQITHTDMHMHTKIHTHKLLEVFVSSTLHSYTCIGSIVIIYLHVLMTEYNIIIL